MKRDVCRFLCLCTLWPVAAVPAVLQNSTYRIELLKDGAVEIEAGSSVRRQFAPVFTILIAKQDPQLSYRPSKEEAYIVPSWRAREGGTTMDLFKADTQVEMMHADSAALINGTVRWHFSEGPAGKLEAELTLPPSGDPGIRFRFTPKSDAWYSVGFTGAPAVQAAKIEALWQPLIWQERRFPRLSFLSVERMCSLPAAIVSSGGGSVAVVADPDEVPFRIPSFQDSRFGVLVRNADAQAQPALFAPVLGSPGANAIHRDQTDAWRYGAYPRPAIPTGPPSRMKSGEPFSFRLRLVLKAGGWYPVFRHVAENLYGFHDYRENTSGSLNDTIENMIAFAMNDTYSGWVDDLKGFDYTTDVGGTVKVVSALHPLSVALLTDNREIFRRRALPITEYLMSREKYLFSLAPGITGQNPSHFLRGPAAEVSELAALFQMSGSRSTVFRHYAEQLNETPRALNLLMVSDKGSWQNELALYRMSGDKAHLEKARNGADQYIHERIDRPATDFSDVHIEQGGQFWSDFAPKWIDLFELYEETDEPKYLKAAAQGAKEYATFAWLQPAIPDTNVMVNPHNQVGVHTSIPGIHLMTPMQAPEQSVPAWRVSQIGLVPEASTTYDQNPAVFLAHHAAYMLRIGEATGDPFLKAVARSAIIGRYANFPGYDINGEYTTVYERPDYPLRTLKELTYNQIYYNHVWPHIALLFDFLISDVAVRSEGQISFPSRYAQGYAYLQSNVYGDRTGVFYGHQGVQLWMPAKLLRIDNPQVNYVAGYDHNSLYLALSNQSPRPVTAKIRINSDLAPYSLRQDYKVRTWQANREGPSTTLRNGEFTLSIPASGLTGIAVDGIRIVPQFQSGVLDSGPALSDKSYTESETTLGKVTGMLLSFGVPNTSAYVWFSATEKEVSTARLHYRLGGSEWNVLEDSRYPYDFSLPMAPADASLSYWIEAEPASGGRAVKSETVELRK
jgi:hypothetical protein